MYFVGEGVTAPRVLSRVEPVYTEEAVRAKVWGCVVVSCDITPEGHAANFRIIAPIGYGLDQKVIDAIEQWIFAPASKNGTPVPASGRLIVKFERR